MSFLRNRFDLNPYRDRANKRHSRAEHLDHALQAATVFVSSILLFEALFLWVV